MSLAIWTFPSVVLLLITEPLDMISSYVCRQVRQKFHPVSQMHLTRCLLDTCFFLGNKLSYAHPSIRPSKAFYPFLSLVSMPGATRLMEHFILRWVPLGLISVTGIEHSKLYLKEVPPTPGEKIVSMSLSSMKCSKAIPVWLKEKVDCTLVWTNF